MKNYDVIIIGGGITGTGIAHELAKYDVKTALMERGTVSYTHLTLPTT